MMIPYDSVWVQTFGRLHLVVLHFPIALLILAAGAVLWRMIRDKAGDDRYERVPGLGLVAVGAVSAVGAAAMGWVYAGGEFQDIAGDLSLHRWLGVASAAVAAVSLFVGMLSRKVPGKGIKKAYLAGVMMASALVGLTGHIGGELVQGEGFLTEPLLEHYFPKSVKPGNSQAQEPEDQSSESSEAVEPGQQDDVLKGPSVDYVPGPDGRRSEVQAASGEPIRYDPDIAAILEANCVKCHRKGKSRGRVRLDTLDRVMRVVEPGDPDESLLIQMIELPEYDPDVMPQDAPKLPQDTIDQLIRWVRSLRPDNATAPAEEPN
ncbi:MAG TPA: hypothetical protein ENJ00_04995 [Phycisphaerales bacterium]|nr:hypothetical protein [Phycisphaerales bacterium]